jgi:hypothetical protein
LPQLPGQKGRARPDGPCGEVQHTRRPEQQHHSDATQGIKRSNRKAGHQEQPDHRRRLAPAQDHGKQQATGCRKHNGSQDVTHDECCLLRRIAPRPLQVGGEDLAQFRPSAFSFSRIGAKYGLSYS